MRICQIYLRKVGQSFLQGKTKPSSPEDNLYTSSDIVFAVEAVQVWQQPRTGSGL